MNQQESVIKCSEEMLTPKNICKNTTTHPDIKPIAYISVCGIRVLTVTNIMQWFPPTEEQRKNLKETFCIDVEILE